MNNFQFFRSHKNIKTTYIHTILFLAHPFSESEDAKDKTHIDSLYLSIWFKMKYLFAIVLFTALIVGTCYGNWQYISNKLFFSFYLVKTIKYFLNNVGTNDLEDLANKAKTFGDCTSKCTTNNAGDVNALLECTKGCGNGALSFKANTIVMIALFFMSYYLIN